MRPDRRSLVGSGGCALLLLGATGPAAARITVQAIPVDLSTPLAPSVVPSEGQRHLLYELHLTNFGRMELSLQRLEALDAESGRLVAAYEGETLTGILARPGVQTAECSLIGGGLSAVAFIDIVIPAGEPVPRRLLHRLVFKPVKIADAARLQDSVIGFEVAVLAAPPVVLGPPLGGSGWVALNGLSNASSHRRTLITLNGRTRISQRYAIDWTRIDADGQAFRGDPAKNSNWSAYGAEVLAVADGRVVDLQDGIAENDPTSDAKAVPITYESAPGNYLVLDIGQGRYAFYAHLRPGSLKVALGQRVRRGEGLARVGNSGKADAPHLHFHLTDGPSPFAAEGQPFVFDRYELQGHVPSLKLLTDGTGWRPDGPASLRRRELPLQNAVVGFQSPA